MAVLKKVSNYTNELLILFGGFSEYVLQPQIFSANLAILIFCEQKKGREKENVEPILEFFPYL